MLIVFSGLPGTGKTTIARRLASRVDATYLRVDAIEQALRDAEVLAHDVGRSGYLVAIALAQSNLGLGRMVIVDCVNPVAESREAWREIASRAGVRLLDIEVFCSDTRVHQLRVETRTVDVPGLKPPTWQSVLEHDYEAWGKGPLRLDSAVISPDEAVEAIMERMSSSTF
ncbi:AAA family ATPase [Metapseudomonas boanensis]|uniref:AAA family ATPase n=1 Tax=Metapseudomonas boanensis TaxID=2822138 RepID=A0ABS5XBL8_9GAMM|nr:AAA family ATPase [Pseudomonas boanensis]MBT8765087.1 AAA family ATPase [Pseudomonas boanensis]